MDKNMNCIDNYLNNILICQLKRFGVSDSVCNQVTDNIKLQMLSLLECWNDIEFRNTILAVGLEEGEFYKPNAKIEVKCFVVVTIRNSLLETLASDDYKSLSATRAVSDEEIKLITSSAIEYFSTTNFKELAKSLDFSDISNIYKVIKEKYTVAWNMLAVIGNTKKKLLRFEKTKADFDEEAISLIKQEESSLETTYNEVVLSGYDVSMDENLVKILKHAYSNPGFVFFSNSFKMISRNANKLFRVLNILLQCNAIIVTANYYITNGYVEIRKPLIKPAHTMSQVSKDLSNIKGTSTKHSAALKQISKEL